MPDAITVKVAGLREIEQRLLLLPQKLARRHLAKAVGRGGRVLRDLARAKAPVGETGELRKNIIARVRANLKQNKVTATVGVRYRGAGTQDPGVYAMFQEFGTEHAPAQPFLRPALDEGAQPAIAATVETLREGLEDSAKR